MVREQSNLARYNYIALLVQTTSEWGVERLLAFHDVRERWDVYRKQTKLKHEWIQSVKANKSPNNTWITCIHLVTSFTYTRVLTWSTPHSKMCYLLVLFLAAFNVLYINKQDKSWTWWFGGETLIQWGDRGKWTLVWRPMFLGYSTVNIYINILAWYLWVKLWFCFVF